jgi:hypothetical protein
MPELLLSEATAAFRLTVAAVFNVEDGAVVIVTVIGVEETTVAVAEADLLVSLTEVAVRVMELPTIAPEGAIKVALLPLVVELVTVPQLDKEQLVLQVTPFAAASLSTTAIG